MENVVVLALLATLGTWALTALGAASVFCFRNPNPKTMNVMLGFASGVMIAANRYRHIRASRCDRPDQARDDRFHDDTNVLALAADDIDIEMAFLCVQAFLESPFDAVERRIRRIEKIS